MRENNNGRRNIMWEGRTSHLEGETRNIQYDIIRIIAIICVIYNHLGTYEIAYAQTEKISLFLFYQIMALICRCGPPLFFMVSGALLLGKNESFRYIFHHRIVRIIIVMLVCTFLKVGLDFTVYKFIYTFIFDLNWYLYAYLGYLLMLPYLRLIAQNSKVDDILLYFSMVIIFYSISGILWCCKLSVSFFDLIPLYNSTWGSWCWSIIFTLMGYFLTKKEIKGFIYDKKRIGIILMIALLAIYMILVFIDINSNSAACTDLIRQHSNFFPSLILFYICGYIQCTDIRIKRIIMSISNTTFGMFILETHTGLRTYLCSRPFLSDVLNAINNVYIKEIIILCVAFWCYYFIIFIIKKIPLLCNIL